MVEHADHSPHGISFNANNSAASYANILFNFNARYGEYMLQVYR